ncbi:MAG: twin-arginine translocation signal domain-containing protein, partial [Sedimentisphaerales bacterium]
MNENQEKTTRRGFLKAAAAAGATLGLGA